MLIFNMGWETGDRERCHFLHSASSRLPGQSWKQWDTMYYFPIRVNGPAALLALLPLLTESKS